MKVDVPPVEALDLGSSETRIVYQNWYVYIPLRVVDTTSVIERTARRKYMTERASLTGVLAIPIDGILG